MFRGKKLLAAAFAIAGITLLSSSSDAMNLKYNKGPPTGIATAVAPTPTLGSSAAYTFVESGDNTGSYTTQYNDNLYIAQNNKSSNQIHTKKTITKRLNY